MTTNAGRPSGRRHLRRIFAVALATVTVGALTSVPAAAAPTAIPAATAAAPNFGANVTVFDPSTPVAEIQAKLDAAYAQQVNAEMGTNRYAFLFKPGTYGTDAQPLQIKVGYYTEVSGLGASPNDVVINGKVEVYNRCLEGGGTTSGARCRTCPSRSTERVRTGAGPAPTSGPSRRPCRCAGSTSTVASR
jgi:hypothetical protein